MVMKNLKVKKYTKMLQTTEILKKLRPFIWTLLVLVNISHAQAQRPDIKTIVIDPGHGGVDVGAGGRYTREALLALNISLKLREVMQKEMPDVRILMTRETDVLPGNQSNKNDALKWRANFANENNADLFISVHLNSTPANQRWERKQVGTKQQTYYVKQGKKKVAKTRTVPVYEKYRAPATVLGTQTYVLASDYYKGKVASAGRSSSIKEYVDADSLGGMPELDPVEARIKAQQYAKYFFQKSLTLATYVEEEFANIGRYSWGVWQRDWAGAQGIYVLTATQMPSILIETGFIDHPDEEEFLDSTAGQEQMAKSIVNAVKRYREVLQNPEKMIEQATATTEK
jgi:N-acetylmuramoyl-L-alanine amidase